MGRVSAETIERLNKFIDSLPDEAKSKCAICNETLTHIVKQAEATIKAGTATIARVLAEKINEGAAPMDRVSPEALRQRVRGCTTDKNLSGRNDQIESIARQSAERSWDSTNPDEPIEPVIDWGTEDPEKIERIKEISNGHFDVNHDGTIFPIRDPELRKQEHKVTVTIFTHLFYPIDGITSSPVSPDELYGMIPPYCYRKLAKIDEAIAMLTAIKKLHEVNDSSA